MDDAPRSRVVGVLLFSAFIAASLIVLLVTIIAAFGKDDSVSSAAQPFPVQPPPALARSSLCTPIYAAMTPIDTADALADERGLVPQGDWVEVPAHTALPSVDGVCGLVAVVPDSQGTEFWIVGPQIRCEHALKISVSCGTTARNGGTPARARVFAIPEVTREAVAQSNVPPLVYLLHVVFERELLHTPYRAASGIVEIALHAPAGNAPARGTTGCIGWVGISTGQQGTIIAQTMTYVDCGSPPSLLEPDADIDTMWLRPYIRAEGPNLEHVAVPARVTPRPMRRIADTEVGSTLPRGT